MVDRTRSATDQEQQGHRTDQRDFAARIAAWSLIGLVVLVGVAVVGPLIATRCG